MDGAPGVADDRASGGDGAGPRTPHRRITIALLVALIVLGVTLAVVRRIGERRERQRAGFRATAG